MTATTKPPTGEALPRNGVLRFSSLESLGFTNPSSVWSDAPSQTPSPTIVRRGRHEAPEPEPDTVADWEPQDFVARLDGRNFRWGILVTTLLVIAGLGAGALWLYQRPVAQMAAAVETIEAEAASLADALATLESSNETLVSRDDSTTDLTGVDATARSLFNAGAGLSADDTQLRSAAGTASSAALDVIRLIGDADSYRLAVTSILMTPELETDPSLIELDQAARDFGSWQLQFDEVRTALPEGVMSDTTQRLDILSGDLPGFLTRYMDALRDDDQRAANEVVSNLATRLDEVSEQLTSSLTEVQTRVTERITEIGQALEALLP